MLMRPLRLLSKYTSKRAAEFGDALEVTAKKQLAGIDSTGHIRRRRAPPGALESDSPPK
jgi:hypothetical protein